MDEPRLRGTGARIGLIEPEWNDFDKLTPETKMIHNTRRKTQPWKSGLPVDFIPAESNLLNPVMLLNRIRRKLFGEYAMLGNYKDHPDERQTQLFFGYLKECLANGLVSEELVKEHMAANHVRHDAFDVIGRTPPLDAGAAEGGLIRSSRLPCGEPDPLAGHSSAQSTSPRLIRLCSGQRNPSRPAGPASRCRTFLQQVTEVGTCCSPPIGHFRRLWV